MGVVKGRSSLGPRLMIFNGNIKSTINVRQQESLAVLLRDEIQKPQNQTKKFNR